MDYSFKITNFEGPLDLLLHLISKAKIEVKDIFVSEVTEQYLQYIREMEQLDMEVSSEFLQMAATLVYIKSRSVLPVRRPDEEELEDGLTPEERLIRQINEYKRFKEAAVALRAVEESADTVYYKLPEEVIANPEQVYEFNNADVHALYEAFAELMAKAPEEKEDERVYIRRDSFSVRDQMKQVLARLTIVSKLEFSELMSERPSREEIAVTFLALLELLNVGKIKLNQSKAFGKLTVMKADR